jgi:hypothetical protein
MPPIGGHGYRSERSNESPRGHLFVLDEVRHAADLGALEHRVVPVLGAVERGEKGLQRLIDLRSSSEQRLGRQRPPFEAETLWLDQQRVIVSENKEHVTWKVRQDVSRIHERELTDESQRLPGVGARPRRIERAIRQAANLRDGANGRFSFRPHSDIRWHAPLRTFTCSTQFATQLFVDGHICRPDDNLPLRLHQLDVSGDGLFVGVFLRHVVAPPQHELTPFVAKSSQRELGDPAVEIESIVSGHSTLSDNPARTDSSCARA